MKAGVQWRTDMILMFPKYDLTFDFICKTAVNVWNRHELLLGAIGVFDQEEKTYKLVTTLSWALPVSVVLGAGVDGLLAYFYMRFFHPWKEILFQGDEQENQEDVSGRFYLLK